MTTTTADVPAAIQVLAAAFADDPLARWLLPGDRYATHACAVFGSAAEASAEHGELAVAADGSAAAVWLPRSAGAPARAEEPPPFERLGTFLELTAARRRAGAAHLYLVFLGVVPGMQGRGLGGALLRERLATADTEGLPAYLEASSPGSKALYERHGFRSVGDPVRLPDGPDIWPMWRAARP